MNSTLEAPLFQAGVIVYVDNNSLIKLFLTGVALAIAVKIIFSR